MRIHTIYISKIIISFFRWWGVKEQKETVTSQSVYTKIKILAFPVLEVQCHSVDFPYNMQEHGTVHDKL